MTNDPKKQCIDCTDNPLKSSSMTQVVDQVEVGGDVSILSSASILWIEAFFLIHPYYFVIVGMCLGVTDSQ